MIGWCESCRRIRPLASWRWAIGMFGRGTSAVGVCHSCQERDRWRDRG